MPDDVRAPQRAALLGQLRYLMDEAAMLRHVLPRVPEPLQEGRAREDALSLKETLALLAYLDTRVRVSALAGIPADAPSDLREAVADAHGQPAEALLDALTEARSVLVEAAEVLPPERWEEPTASHATLYEYLYAVTQEDAGYLRDLTLQLYDAQGLGA